MPALPFPNLVRPDLQQQVTGRTLTAQFGDGYSQRAPNGLNAVVKSFNVTWRRLNQADKDTLVGVLNSVGSWGVLTWMPPFESVEKKFIVDANTGYSILYEAGWFIVSTRLTEVFDLFDSATTNYLLASGGERLLTSDNYLLTASG